jgi:hypothetical protein
VLLTLPHPGPEALANANASAIPVGPEEQPLELETQETEYRLFPPPSALISDPNLDQTLRGLGFGYRAGFIVNSLALLVAEHGSPDLGEGTEEGTITTRGVKAFLESLRYESEEERGKWRTELIRLKGVGRKVADCIGLMSMDKVSGDGAYARACHVIVRFLKFPFDLHLPPSLLATSDLFSSAKRGPHRYSLATDRSSSSSIPIQTQTQVHILGTRI